MNTLKKYWKAIVGVVGSIIGFILLRQFMQRDLKAELKNAETSGKSAVLSERANNLNNQAQEIVQENAKLKAQAEQPANVAEPKTVVDYWKKN